MSDDIFKKANSLIMGKANDLAQLAKTKVTGEITGALGSGLAVVKGIDNIVKDPIAALTGGKALSGLAGSSASQKTPTADSMRIRLRAQDGQAHQVYGGKQEDNILRMLHDTNGMLFPYTPVIDWNQAVEYNTLSLTHANQDFLSYKNTPSTEIGVTGDFTVQNQREGEYVLAVLHFLRVVSKMYFGKQAAAESGREVAADKGISGMPPPILIFSGYGNYMFNDLPVIVKSHSYSFGKEVDYVDVTTAGGKVRLPSLLTISLRLVVQNTPQKLREKFDLDQFRTGELMRKDKGWI